MLGTGSLFGRLQSLIIRIAGLPASPAGALVLVVFGHSLGVGAEAAIAVDAGQPATSWQIVHAKRLVATPHARHGPTGSC
jgi:hypothetical protein